MKLASGAGEAAGRMMMAGVGLTAALVAALFALSACGTNEFNDAPTGENDKAPADVIAFPDGFSNVAFKCSGPNMVYSSSNGSDNNSAGNRASIAVVANDPRCADK